MAIAESILRTRVAQTERMLSEQALDVLMVYALGSSLGPGTRSHGYMRYLCDWDSHWGPSLLLLRPGHAPVLLVSSIFSTFFAAQYFWIKDVRFVKAPELCAEAARICRDMSPSPQRIALLGRNEMPVIAWEACMSILPHREWLDFSAKIDQQRLIKSSAQLAIHEQSAQICDAMFDTLRREIKQPRPGFQLQAEMERTARYAGAENCITWLTISPVADYSRFFKEECQRTPQPGDQVLAGILLLYDGHWGHAVRSGSMGAPSAGQRKVFSIAFEMADKMLAALQPEGDLNAVQSAAEDTLRQHFSPAELAQVFRFRHGHGLGHSYEEPVSSVPFPQMYDIQPAQAVKMAAQPGMLFELHPNLFVPGVGGACIGDMAVVTTEGNRLLTKYPREMIQWLD